MTEPPARSRLALYLAEARLTKAAFARRIKRDRVFVAAIVAGTRRPSLDTAIAIERATEAWTAGPIRPAEWAKNRARGDR